MYKSYIEEIHAINRDTREFIDSFHKEPESCAAYLEQNNANFNSVANITVDSDSTTLQKKKNQREEDSQEYRMIAFSENARQEYRMIPFDKNEANKSIISSKKIETNGRKTIDPNAGGKI